jgi:capsular polysaccharide biosynthesis protein
MASESVKKKQEEEIDLLKLAKVLWRKIWIILICAIILGVAGYYWTYRKMYTSYKSSAMIYVNNNSVSLGSAKLSLTSGDIKAVNNLMETYSVILKSRTTLNEIIQETGIPFTYEQLRDMITAETVGDTAIFKITVTASDPELSAHLCNSIMEVLPGKIQTIIEGASAQVVDYAVTGEPYVNGRPVKTAAIGALIGIVFSCGIIIFLSLIDTKVRSEEYLLETFKDLPILTSIPDLNESGKGGYYGYRRSESNTAARQPAHSSDDADDEPTPMRPGNEGK